MKSSETYLKLEYIRNHLKTMVDSGNATQITLENYYKVDDALIVLENLIYLEKMYGIKYK
jgi:hypothetical protein